MSEPKRVRREISSCQLCGGFCRVYSSEVSGRWRLQYRKCDMCQDTSKSRQWIDQERRLTPNELALLPEIARLVPDSNRFEVVAIVRLRTDAKM